MVSETLELVIRTSGASSAGDEVRRIGSNARAANASIASLNETLAFMRKTLVALSFIRVFEGIATGISEAQQMNNQLIQIAKTAQDIPKAFAMFSQIATATHAPVASVVNLGVQIARSSSSYKMSAKDIGESVQTIFNTFRLSGSDPTTIRNVTKDLKEIFSLGVVQGRQFRAVILQDQAEALLLAKHIHATGAGAASLNKELDAMRAKGQLPDIYEEAIKHHGAFTGADVMRANIEANAETNKKVSQLPVTLGQAFTDLQTKWLSFLNSVSNSGIFQPIIDFVEFLANNLPTIGVTLLAVGSAIGSWLIIRAVTAAFSSFFTLVTTSAGAMVLPFILLGTVLAALFGERLNEEAKAVGGWGELIIRILAAVGAQFQTIFGNLGAVIGNAFVTIINGIVAGLNFLSSKLNSVLPSSLQIGTIPSMANPYAAQLQGSFQEHLAKNYKVLESAFGKSRVSGTPTFVQPAAPASETDQLKDRTAKMLDALQSLENMLSRFAGPAAKFNDDISKVTTKIINWTSATHDAKGNTIAPLLTEAQVAAKFAAVGFDDYNKTTHMSVKFTQDVAREVLGLKNANEDFVHTQDMVNKAIQIGAINQAQGSKILDDARRKRDLYNLSLYTTLDAGIKAAQINFAEKRSDLDKIGGAVATKALGMDFSGDIGVYRNQLSALNKLMESGAISNRAYVATLQDIQKEYLSTATDAMSGFERGLLSVQKTMFDTSGDAAKAMTDAFNGLNDSLVTFATTGKISVHDMAMSILKDFDSIAVKDVFMQPLVSALGFGPGSGLGIGKPGGLGGILGTIFGGSLGTTGTAQLGASAASPMWVAVAPAMGDVFGGASTGGAGSAAGLFSKGSLMGSGGFFSNLFSGKGGGAGSTSSGILSLLGGVGSFLGFAGGGSFMVGGQGGTDSQLVAFRASPDEQVSVMTPQQRRSASHSGPYGMPASINLHLHGVTDYDSFKRSESQIYSGMANAITRSRSRGS